MEFATCDVSNANNPNPSTLEKSANQEAEIEVTEVPQVLNNNVEPEQLSVVSLVSDTVRDSDVISVTVEMSSNTEEPSTVVQKAENSGQETNENERKKSNKHDKKHGKPKEEVTFRTHLTSLAHVSAVVFVYLVLKLAFRGDFVFFTWHPILMAIGWMLLMTEGFYAINKYNTYWRFKTKGGFRVKIHVCILSAGYILSLIGFIIVYINKDNNGKPHFVTWHALFGLIGLISTFPPVLNGVALWYKKELVNYIPNPRLLKFVHVSCGTLAFCFGALALVLSVYTRWYGKKSNHSDYIFYLGLVTVTYPLVWAIYGPSVKLARVIKDYFSEGKED